ncbi:hypothetical protein [Sphingomonas sp. CCH5-D11]|uniref:hypothetical protein n=1 Tax=Sphingomonas sp. CCH5-D11 TaxID=1768786 RepID=UPI000A952094|nr:hypothetical protein [Sphingomonas sp. CCH5-D11]
MTRIISRRDVVVGAGAGALIAGMPAMAQPRAGLDLSELLARQFEESLSLSPELATFMGIDTGSRATLRARLHDHSMSGAEAINHLEQRQLRELKAIAEAGLSPEQRLEREVTIF